MDTYYHIWQCNVGPTFNKKASIVKGKWSTRLTPISHTDIHVQLPRPEGIQK